MPGFQWTSLRPYWKNWVSLDNVKDRIYPPHLQRLREEIEYLEEYLDEAVAFGK
ncbi:hypothetical protein MKW94_017152, partial [Papaver nudicaule]|nr:hypothetical protein [Papaver nudicaule]